MTDFTKKKGESGPSPAPAKPTIDISVVAVPKTDVACGGSYAAIVTLNEVVPTCEGFDYNGLYDLANALVDANLAKVKCVPASAEDACSAETHIIAQSWNCATANNICTVSVSLTKRVDCARTPGDAAAFPQKPTQQELKTPDAKGNSGSEQDKTNVLNYVLPECGGQTPVWLHVVYSEEIDCEKTENFEPFVDKAKARAVEFAGKIPCASPCVPRAELEQFSWVCEFKRLTVHVFYKLYCVKPGELKKEPAEAPKK